MPQPNKGSAGKPNIAQPIMSKGEQSGAKGTENVKFGAPGGTGTRGK